MPQVEITGKACVKESQADADAAARIDISYKDNFVEEYDGVKRVVLEPESTKVIEVGHITSLRTVCIENTSENSVFRLRLRKIDTEQTDLVVGRFFMADVRNVDQIKLINESEQQILVRVFLSGEPTEG